MIDIFKFRMSGSQSQRINELLSSAKEKQVVYGLCGIGICRREGVTYQSFSLTNSIYCDSLESLWQTVDNSKITVNAITIFHDKDPDHKTCLINDIQHVYQLRASTPRNCRFIICNICDDGRCSASILQDGVWQQFDSSCVSGADVLFSFREFKPIPEQSVRTSQAFGEATTKLIGRLSVGVVGVSGTGSLVAEQLYRLGVNELVLVDDDLVETKNLNRIVNSTADDAKNCKNKAIMMAEAFKKNGLMTNTIALPTVIATPITVHNLSQCDILFGCMDSVDGRHQLNRLATFYSIPYFDIGIKLESDGHGGIREIGGVINYLQPDGMSLIDRGVYSVDELTASDLKRSNPREYQDRLKAKYIKGVVENSPAVISVNMTLAGMAVNEMLARLHPYRCHSNTDFDAIYVDLSEPRIRPFQYQVSSKQLSKHIGEGDQTPLLLMPSISEG